MTTLVKNPPASGTYIQSIKTVLPRFEVSQHDAAQWLSSAYEFSHPERASADQRVRRMYEKMSKRSGIATRRSVIEDYTRPAETKSGAFNKDGGFAMPDLNHRMETYCSSGLELAREAYHDANLHDFDRIYLISCTGYDSPSLLQRILPDGWHGQYVMIGHMGCYASLPALSIACDALIGAGHHKASLFSCELCTVHLDPTANDPAQQVINMLFADGAVRFDIGTEAVAGGFEVVDHFERFLPGTLELMTWRPATNFFAMQLSPEIPQQVSNAIFEITTEFLLRHQLELNDIEHWAIHPGGMKIIEAVGEKLKLDRSRTAASLKVYESRGNMSSATVPHIWQVLMQDETYCRRGDYVCSLAFGPGLTIVGNLLRRC